MSGIGDAFRPFGKEYDRHIPGVHADRPVDGYEQEVYDRGREDMRIAVLEALRERLIHPDDGTVRGGWCKGCDVNWGAFWSQDLEWHKESCVLLAVKELKP